MPFCDLILGCLISTSVLLTNYFPTTYAQLKNRTQPEVTISQGNLRGTTLTARNGRDISAFLGIPYAQPPIGNLRFANPVPAVGWNGTLDASAVASKCPQYSSDMIVGDEDCLYVNVYTPSLTDDTNATLLPVMVYIHGGAFKREDPVFGGPEYLLDANVVLVVVYYRLGALGFLSTGDDVASGNWGLKDQVLALKWVQDNIRYFGGDPDQVTIFGESAGAVSVHILTLSNATNGLFHRYITQSGSALVTCAHQPRAAYSRRAFELGEYVGCSNITSDSLISCLRTINFSDIIATDPDFMVWKFFPDLIWGPTDEPDIEGALLTDSPSNLFDAGKIRDLPWMSGVVRDEGLGYTSVFHDDEGLLYDFLENIDIILPLMLSWTYESDLGAARTKAVKSYYFNDDLTSDTNVLLTNLTMLISDSIIYYPARDALRKHHALAVNPQYLYTFNYRGSSSREYGFTAGSTVSYGVAHGDDLMYLFPKKSVPFSALNEMMSETDYEMVDTMVQLWTSFAINGTPTASALMNSGIIWEPYSSEDNHLIIGNESDVGVRVGYAFFEERMDFWTNIDSAVDSGTSTSCPNLILLLLVACSKFILSPTTNIRC